MLTQQINLFKFLRRPPKFQIKPTVMVIWYIVFFILLLIDHSHSIWLSNVNKKQLTELNTVLNQKKAQLENLMRKYPVFSEKDLISSVSSFKEQLTQKMKVLNLLTPGANFSRYLAGFAKVIPEGVWLSEINFLNIDQSVAFTGFGVKPLTIQIFLDELSKATEFNGQTFGIIELTQIPQDKNSKVNNYLSFRGSSKTNGVS